MMRASMKWFRSFGGGRFLALVALCLAVCLAAAEQNSDPAGHARPVIRRVAPVYPALAKRAGMMGSVRLVVTVAPNGSVKSIEILGGNPVLLEAAQQAVVNWKFAAGPAETREVIQFRFEPD
jgi:TonB family protein